MKKIICFIIILIGISLSAEDKITIILKDSNKDEWRNKTNQYRLNAIARDVINADLNQLKAIAMALGLKEMDTAAEYRKAIAEYYGIKLIDRPFNKKGDKIEILYAGELKYMKFTEVDEENLHLLGRARIRISSTSDKTTVERYIEADEIFINTKNKEITGIGNVYYKDDRLEYEGTQFYYNFKLKKGVLFEGRTQLIKGGESGLDGAYFNGKKVVQSGDENITLYDGSLTTCEEENPHYYMKVTRLWVSEKGEWGILNGVVFIGPVPFFYFPVYYHPKNLIINPSFGFKSRHGWYFNSTYYIIGSKEDQAFEDDLPVSQTTVTNASAANKATLNAAELIKIRRQAPIAPFRITRESRNIKLEEYYTKHKIYSRYPVLKLYPKYDSIDISLNIFADAYTNLGLYFGMFFYAYLNYPNNPIYFKVMSDFAFSRNIWQEGDQNVYDPYNPDDKTAEARKPNTYSDPVTQNPLIFRSSQWINISGELMKKHVNLKFDFQLEYASDKYYFIDFYNRRQDFTYIDLLADTVSSAVNKQSESAFQTKEKEEVTSDYNNIRTYFKIDFSPRKVPEFFGLPMISSLILNLETHVLFEDTAIAGWDDRDAVYDPRKQRYLLKYFSLPGKINPDGSFPTSPTLSMTGTLLDYDVVLSMPEKINKYKEEIKNREVSDDDKLQKALYDEIEELKLKDATSDTGEINYRNLTPFLSKKNRIDDGISKLGRIKFNKVIFDDKSYIDKVISDEDKKKEDLKKNKTDYFTVQTIELNKAVIQQEIKTFSASLNYEFSETIVNRYFFEPKTDILGDDNRVNTGFLDEFDTVQSVLYSMYNQDYNIVLSKFLKRLNVVHMFSLTLKSPVKILQFSGSGVFDFNPVFSISNKKYYDYENLYMDYMYKTYFDPELDLSGHYRSQIIENNIETAFRKGNRQNTELILNYSDTIRNNLSFGLYRIQGTEIVTNINIDLFRYNHDKEYYFRLFDQYNPNFVDPVYYYNRVIFERFNKLDTTFSFKVNIFPKDYSHVMNMSVSPQINWFIQKETLDVLKQELWIEEDGLNQYNTDGGYVLNEAKEYMYYRSQYRNLTHKVWGGYYGYDFWNGRKYYRKMFNNINFNFYYSYTYSKIKVIEIKNDLKFKLDNIGVFSGLDKKAHGDISVYPDDAYSMSFLNSIITYAMGITFTKVNNVYIKSATVDDFKLDEYKIMTMDNSHSIGLKMPGDLFLFKLPAGNWLDFTNKITFKWDRTLNQIGYYEDIYNSSGVFVRTETHQRWADDNSYNYFYLNEYSIKLNLIMDIIRFELNFRKFNFDGTGYGLELDNGLISIGYNITQIPVFFRYFKLTLYPQILYNFVVKHNNYWDNNTIYSFNSNYYTNNVLIFKFEAALEIAKGTKFETIFKFTVQSENRKMYKYYDNDNGFVDFFYDLGKSFNFGNIKYRRESPFKLKYISVSVEHNICDWKLMFMYIGQPVKNNKTYTWENIFEFNITWQVRSRNQLMKMFNKTKVNAVYNRDKDNNSTGEWRQPIISLDPNEE